MKPNKAQLAFIAEHPEMVQGYEEEQEKKKDQCQCKEPDFAYSEPSLRTDGTYFQYCKLCLEFKDVPKPATKELVF